MKLLCTADIHLGAGANYGATGERLRDQAEVLGRIAGVAVERGVDGILIAGDVFNGPTITPEQLEVFAKFVDACNIVGVPILACTGNGAHDAAVRDTNGMAIFGHVPGIQVCSQPGVHGFAGCSVAVLPWVHPGRLIARAGRDVPRDEVNRIAADLLVDVAAELRETARFASGPSILLGHWSVSGTALPTGLPVDDLREPVLPIEALEQLGYDAIVFGHIHRSQPIGATGFYTGSPMPLNFGEAHVEHGVYILELSGDVFEGVETEFVPIDSPRFVTVDAAGEELARENRIDCFVEEAVVTDAIVRVKFTATSEQMRRVDVAAIRASLVEAGARHVKVEPQIVREQRARVAGVSAELGVLDALEQWLDASTYQGDRELLRSRAAMYLETVA